MNSAKALGLLAGILFSGGAPALADSPTEASLQKLQADRERAIAAATQPIDRQYAAALGQLLRVTMQRGDLDGAIKVKEAITAAAGASAKTPGRSAGSGSGTEGPLGNATGAKRFAGTKWVRSRIRVEFNADGSYRNIYGGTRIPSGKWKASSATVVVVTSPDGQSEEFIWNGNDTINYGQHLLTPLDPNISLEDHARSAANPVKPDAAPAGPANHFGKPMPPSLPATP